MEKWLNLGLRQGQYRMSLEHLFLASIKKYAKMDGNISRGHMCQARRAPICQITDN